jgi:hypothetical protein
MSLRDIIITRDTKVPCQKTRDGKHMETCDTGERKWTVRRGTLGTIESVSGIVEIPALQGVPCHPEYMKTKIFDTDSLLGEQEYFPHFLEY